ncbi:MAG: DUF6476 family protein [Gammaproteobacteria bacterium]
MAGEIAPAPEAGQDPVNVRILKWVVIVLGVFLIAALVTVFGVIGYRLARPKPQLAPGETAIALPVRPGTEIGQFDLDGNRIAVHLRHQTESELVVIDVRSGKVLSRIKLDETSGGAD